MRHQSEAPNSSTHSRVSYGTHKNIFLLLKPMVFKSTGQTDDFPILRLCVCMFRISKRRYLRQNMVLRHMSDRCVHWKLWTKSQRFWRNFWPGDEGLCWGRLFYATLRFHVRGRFSVRAADIGHSQLVGEPRDRNCLACSWMCWKMHFFFLLKTRWWGLKDGGYSA